MSDSAGFAQSFACGAELHAMLVRRAHDTDADNPDEVLNLAVAVAIHGLLELTAVLANARYVSAELRAELEGEHAELREALRLMEELGTDPEDLDDLVVLCRAVHEKIVRHVERDERVIYGSLARLDAFSPTEPE